MRILHLVRVFGYGGAENHVRDLANVMEEMGHQVFVMAWPGNQNELLNKGVKFEKIRMTDTLALFQIFRVRKFIKKNQIDIVHVHQRLPAFIGALAARFSGIPAVVTVHGKTQYDVRLPVVRKMISKFIFVRQSTLNESKDYGVPDYKSVLIQNGVRIEPVAGDRNMRSLCYISRIDKRHSSVISLIMNKVLPKLADSYPGLSFHIVGDGDQLTELKSEAYEINKMTGANTIVVEGYLPDVKTIIKKSGMIFGVGRVAIETLACGVPLFSINQKYFGGLISSENYDFFRQNNFVAYGLEPPDELKISTELERYLKDTEFWQAEAAVLQQHIDNDFNIYKIVSTIIDIYSQAIKTYKRKNSNPE